MQAVLVMFRSDGERRSFSLTRDVTVIGRREDADLRIPLGDVSRKHARLIREPDGVRIEDLGSSNGTYLNGQRIEREAVLQPGDSIQVGPVVFVLQIDGYPQDEELHPMTVEGAAAGAMLGAGAAGA
jgi:pSer/pThr/pTyr-binding forkhead associated (FHA) protein